MRITKNVISDHAGETVDATIAEDVETITAAITAPPMLPMPPSTTIESRREIRS